MKKLLKYLPLVAIGKDISDAYEEETGKGRPFYLSRRFVGGLITLVATFIGIKSGIKFDANILKEVTDNISNLISACVSLYGLVIMIIGIVRRNK